MLANRTGLFLLYLGIAFVNWVRDGLNKVVPHAAFWVRVAQVWVRVIAGLVAAGRLDQAQQGAAHQDQQEARRGTHGDHDRDTLRLLILAGCPTRHSATSSWRLLISHDILSSLAERRGGGGEGVFKLLLVLVHVPDAQRQEAVRRKAAGGWLRQAAPSHVFSIHLSLEEEEKWRDHIKPTVQEAKSLVVVCFLHLS